MEYLTCAEVAELLNVDIAFAFELSLGSLPHTVRDNVLLFEKPAVDNYHKDMKVRRKDALQDLADMGYEDGDF